MFSAQSQCCSAVGDWDTVHYYQYLYKAATERLPLTLSLSLMML